MSHTKQTKQRKTACLSQPLHYFITQQQKWVSELLKMFIYKLCSKWLPFAQTHTVSQHCRWSIAMSIMCCSKSFYTVIRQCQSSSTKFRDVQCNSFMMSSSHEVNKLHSIFFCFQKLQLQSKPMCRIFTVQCISRPQLTSGYRQHGRRHHDNSLLTSQSTCTVCQKWLENHLQQVVFSDQHPRLHDTHYNTITMYNYTTYNSGLHH